jgi:hypothetical protein
MRVIGYVIAALLAAVCAVNAATDKLSALYTEVLQRPADSETNLRYARAAEAAGELPWAYAAYERVVLNDPTNREAQEGLVRVARRLQPSFTEFLLQAGASYESNPLYGRRTTPRKRRFSGRWGERRAHGGRPALAHHRAPRRHRPHARPFARLRLCWRHHRAGPQLLE